MSECMTQEDAMNMSDEQAVQILKPFRDMMIDRNGCPISDAVFALDKAIVALSKKMPTVEERKKGKWIKEGGFRHYIHYCSECGWALMDGPRGEPPYIGMEFNRANYERRYVLAGWTEEVMNFCPNCGADMRGE